MVSAELRAEAGIGHVLVGQNEIDSVGVVGQVLALDGIVDNRLDIAVAVGGVDLFLRRPTQVLEVVIDNALVLGAPVAVPDDVNGGSFLKNRSAVVVDVAGAAIAICLRVWRLVIWPQSVGSIVLGGSRA